MANDIQAGRRRQSFADPHDIDEFVRTLEQFERGEISADAWRKFRLVRGTYGQRQDDVQMLRVKIPQGILTANQLTAIADVAERYSRGFAHVTTRQNVQFHFLRLHDVEAVMRRLADDGLTTREACGNSVRNITACPFAGVSPDELFDVTPYAEALTRYLLRHPLSACLPRKFKIAFEGCSDDHAFTSINDIGWIAQVQHHGDKLVRGFRVSVGGGTSILATSGRVLLDFIPAEEMLEVAEAIVRVFHRLGDYEHKQRNRMKFLIKTLGWERWRAEVLDTLTAVRGEERAAQISNVLGPAAEEAPAWNKSIAPSLEWIDDLMAKTALTGPGIRPRVAVSASDREAWRRWQATNVRRQRQDGYVVGLVRLPLGDITAGQLRVVAALGDAYGDGTVRLTPDQNVFIRWVEEKDLPHLFARLARAGLADPDAATVADVTSCPGAESCRLAVTQSRGLARTLTHALATRPDLVGDAATATVKISGCPNGCGQHHVATIGFQGSVRKLNGRAVPQYFVMLGGAATTDGAKFGRLTAKIPAARVPVALERLLELYRQQHAADETPSHFFARVELSVVKPLLADLEVLSADAVQADDYIDLGDKEAFAPEILDGECAT